MTKRHEARKPVQTGGTRRRRLVLALVVMCGVCIFAVVRSPLFRFDEAVITGAEHLTEARVLEIAGLFPGTRRWERPSSAIEARLTAEPWVSSVEASWEGNQVAIRLTEREPVALLRYHAVSYLAIDESGLILEQVDLQHHRGLPVIAGIDVTGALRGQRLTDPGLADSLTVLSRMAPTLRDHVSEAKVEDGALTLYMVNGATVKWGVVPQGKDREETVIKKIELFGGYWQSISEKRMSECHIDLRVDGKVIPSGCQ